MGFNKNNVIRKFKVIENVDFQVKKSYVFNIKVIFEKIYIFDIIQHISHKIMYLISYINLFFF